MRGNLRWRACSRDVACAGLLFLVLCQTVGCGDDSSPTAPTPRDVIAEADTTSSGVESSDLTVSVTTSSSGAPPGASFTLSATVRNDGDGAAAATTLRYYRSTDATVTTADTSVGTDAVAELAAGATSSESVSLTAPSSAGAYYYDACVEAVSGESDTTNNCSGSVQVDVSEPDLPDLVVVLPTVDESSPAVGVRFTLSITVRNDGNGDSPATILRYYRSTDATISTADTGEGSQTLAGLAASESITEYAGLTAPLTTGTYYYGACVDAVTDESDTTNNCSGSVEVTVEEPAPDLVVLGPDVSDSVETGGTFRLLVSVQNVGEAQSVATTVRYYRSTDATITTSDTSVGTEPVRALGAGKAARKRFF